MAKFNCIINYYKLDISDEYNDIVSNFLEKACDHISNEINQEYGSRFNMDIDYIYIDKSDDGYKKLIEKYDNFDELFFTNGFPGNRDKELEYLAKKKYIYLHHAPEEVLKNDLKKNMFCLGKSDLQSRVALIDDEIKLIKNNNKIYYLHNEKRLYSEIIESYSNLDNFYDFSLNEYKEKIDLKIKEIFSNIKPEELIILDVSLKYLREIFLFLENINAKNKVIMIFGTIEGRFKKISFNLIKKGGYTFVRSLANLDLMNKVAEKKITPEVEAIIATSLYRLEIPLLVAQALNKCSDEELSSKDIDAIKSSILSFDGETDIFLGKRLEYGFDKDGNNILKEDYCYTYPSALQTKDYQTPRMFYMSQYFPLKNGIKKYSVIYVYIDMERILNISINTGTWTAEFYIDIVANVENPIDEIIFNNVSSTNDKFVHKLLFEKEEENSYYTRRYHVVANFEFVPLAENFPFDWQNLYIAQTVKNSEKYILQPVSPHLVDENFDINGWNLEDSFTGIKYKKNVLYKGLNLQKTVQVTKENRVGWILKRKNTATLLKIGIPLFFLIFLVYYSTFIEYKDSHESIGILTTTFLSAIALYFSVEKPEPKKMTIVDLVFVWFYFINGITIITYGLTSFFSQSIFYSCVALLKIGIPLSLIGLVYHLRQRLEKNRDSILLDRDT